MFWTSGSPSHTIKSILTTMQPILVITSVFTICCWYPSNMPQSFISIQYIFKLKNGYFFVIFDWGVTSHCSFVFVSLFLFHFIEKLIFLIFHCGQLVCQCIKIWGSNLKFTTQQHQSHHKICLMPSFKIVYFRWEWCQMNVFCWLKFLC